LTLTTTEARCVVHFAKEEFARCRTMDTALEQLAKRHVETRFVRLEATEAPWVVERLKVRVLPCVMGFVGGKSVARITGFEGLGGGREEQSGFSLGKLERKLVEYGVLER
ncbi:thioredoxin-like protein, partial [Piedraia hortae CBS 480.64]